ncbi:hypothetical protein DOTSEDRAFT_82570 [Dothistroma septosporum NZE10]|uniref:Uncharacterized protein n=1 Tax=Dothistroma septosporum (strain NZE10 / CBS 128990) TaxID=675120 RepID=N1PDV4_DOTSN|nr:hypothetical protein DOTSEDRAFT_82570 [Dothistroma septosporum NZE10]
MSAKTEGDRLSEPVSAAQDANSSSQGSDRCCLVNPDYSSHSRWPAPVSSKTSRIPLARSKATVNCGSEAMDLVGLTRGMSREEKALYLNKILDDVRTIAASDPELGLSLKNTRTRDDERFEMFAKYKGPDKKTLSFLTDLEAGNVGFWNWVWGEVPLLSGNNDPLALMVKSYMCAAAARNDDG